MHEYPYTGYLKKLSMINKVIMWMCQNLYVQDIFKHHTHSHIHTQPHTHTCAHIHTPHHKAVNMNLLNNMSYLIHRNRQI